MYLGNEIFSYAANAMNLGQRIKDLRVSANLTQEQLGQRFALGEREALSKQAISAWEAGRNQPTAEQLSVLADTFKVSADVLLGRSSEKSETLNLQDVAELITLFGELGPDDRDQLLDFARAAQRRRARIKTSSGN